MTQADQTFDYYSLIGTLVGHWPDMDEKFACEIAELVVQAGYSHPYASEIGRGSAPEGS